MKKFLMLIVASLMMLNVCAKNDNINGVNGIATSNVFDNTSVSVFGVATTPTTFNSVFPLNGGAGIKLAKDVTPVLGFNVEGTTSFGSAIDKGDRFTYHNVVRGLYVGVNGTLNWSNVFGGYNTNRAFTISTEHGLGWIHGFNSSSYGDDSNDFGAKTGIVLNYGFGSTKAWNLFVEPTMYWNLTGSNGVTFNKNHSQVGLELGLTYRFKNHLGTHNFVTGTLYDTDYVKGLNDEIDRLRADNDNLANTIRNFKPTTTTITETKTIPVNKTTTVAFAKNSDELTALAKTTLDEITSGTTVDIKAYASPEGTTEYNKSLSERRANAVADYLKSRNVNVASAEGLGVIDDASNRVAIVVVK